MILERAPFGLADGGSGGRGFVGAGDGGENLESVLKVIDDMLKFDMD